MKKKIISSSQELFQILGSKNPYLSQKANELINFPLSMDQDEEINKLCDTLRFDKGVYKGRGLAISATQVGIMKRYFLFAIGYPRMHKKITAIINPEILDFSKETNTDYEGCLSIPKYICQIERPEKIVIKYQNITGKQIKTELSGFESRHEIDHLNGITMLSRAKMTEPNELYTEYKLKYGDIGSLEYDS